MKERRGHAVDRQFQGTTFDVAFSKYSLRSATSDEDTGLLWKPVSLVSSCLA